MEEIKVKTKKLFFVAADNIENTGRVSWDFMFKAGVSRKIPMEVLDSLRFGWIETSVKDDNYFDVFKWTESEKLRFEGKHEEADKIQFLGDDGNLRLNIFIFESRRGQILFAGINDSVIEREDTMTKLLEKVPENSVILCHRALIDRIKASCELLETECQVFEFEGSLATS